MSDTGLFSPDRRALLAKMLAEEGIRSDANAGPRPRGNAGPAPLSFAQERLWFIHGMHPGADAYSNQNTYRIRGALDIGALERAIAELIRRHDILRTRYESSDGVPVQVVDPPAPYALPLVEVGSAFSEDELERRVVAELSRPFDLKAEAPFRAQLLRFGPEDYVLLINQHHVTFDAWSRGVLQRDLSALYDAFVEGRSSPLPDLVVQYADIAAWQRDSVDAERLRPHLDHWARHLAGDLPVLELPTDCPRPAVLSSRGRRCRFGLPRDLMSALARLGAEERATSFMVFLAALYTLLHRWSGQEDIVVGCPMAGRTHREMEDMIGLFAAPMPLRGDVSGNPTFREFLRRVRDIALEGYAHAAVPFEKIVERLRPERRLNTSPIFQVALTYLNVPAADMAFRGLDVERIHAQATTSPFDITLAVLHSDGRPRVLVSFNADLFDAASSERMTRHLQTLLNGVVADPDRRLSELPIMDSDERRSVVETFNATARDYPRDACIHHVFEQRAAATPEAAALTLGDQSLTYGELNVRANRLARHLRTLGVANGTPVGLCTERTLDMVVAMLGILKAGGAYVPLDPEYPAERLRLMLADTAAPVVVTQRSLRDVLSSTDAACVCLDTDRDAINAHDDVDPDQSGSADDLAYIIYTSGSTGTPKGVEVRHRGVVRLVVNADYVGLNASSVVLHMAPISFDASTFEVWGPLLNGGRCAVIAERRPTIATVREAIRAQGVNTLWLTASYFNTVIDEDPTLLTHVAQVLTGGEALSVDHVRRALKLLPGVRLINGYGPTESATFACCHTITGPLPTNTRSIPIGRPISNTTAYVLDAYGRPVPIGVTGELYLGGDGLARGYLNAPELTAQRFVPNPFSTDPASRLYRTGDLARWRADGVIEFLGRMDHQVKIHGFRVEPGEIEAALRAHPTVREAVVMAREDTPGNRRLVAYATSDTHVDPDVLRGHLEARLPDYMCPSALVVLDRLPLSPNGKVDRTALPAPERHAGATDVCVPPRNRVEEAIAGLWSDLLGRERIGVHEDFFDLGGHSLLAVRLLARVEKSFGRSVAVGTFFRHPTIAGLAREIGGSARPESADHLLPLRIGGGATPFFWICGDQSNRTLPDHLPLNQPIYALLREGADGRPVEYAHLADLVAHYLRLLRSAQPAGPYKLGGYCFGALVAHEMAATLAEEGEDVRLLFLLSPSARVLAGKRAAPTAVAAAPRGRIGRHVRNLSRLPMREKFRYVSERVMGIARRIASSLKIDAPRRAWQFCVRMGWRVPIFLRARYITDVQRAATLEFRPRPYAGRTVVCSHDDLGPTERESLDLLAERGMEVHVIGGSTHLSVLEEPDMSTWTPYLKSALSDSP